MSIKTEKVYLAVNEGDIKAIFHRKEEVKSYVEKMNTKGAHESAAEYGYDKDSPAAYYQNGWDGGLYSWGEVEIPCKSTDDEVFIDEHGESFLVGLNGCAGEEEYTLQEIRDAMKDS